MEKTDAGKTLNSNYCVFSIFITQIPFAFLMGYHLTALNSLTPAIKVFINESYLNRFNEPPTSSNATLILTLSQSCLVWGCLVGALLVKIMLNKFSGKNVILSIHIGFIISSILMGPVAKYGYSYESLIIGRFMNGLGRSIGFSSVCVFVAETTCRARLGFYQSPHGAVQFISCAVGIVLGRSKVLGTAELWMWSLCVPILPSLIYIISWPWINETPVYLIKHGKQSEARIVLQNLRTGDVGDEFEILEDESKYSDQGSEMPLMTILKTPHFRFQFFVVCVAMSAPQFAGVQAITMYSNSVLLDAGVPEEYVTFVSMGIFLQCALSFPIAAFLQRRVGTKRVFISGIFMSCISYALFIISDKLRYNHPSLNTLVIISMFTVVFGIEFGPLFSVLALPSELTSASSRPTIIFYSQCIFWILGGIISFVFPYASDAWGSYSLVPFLVLTAILIPFSVFAIPETHKRTTAAIQTSFRKKSLQSASEIFKISIDKRQSQVTLKEESENQQQTQESVAKFSLA